MREMPKPFEQFMHFKGKRYQVLQIAIHSETREQLVIYQAMYGDYQAYARPLDMFMSEVDHEKYPDVTQKYRFTRIVGDQLVEENSVAVAPSSCQEEVVKETPVVRVNTEQPRERIIIEEKPFVHEKTELTEEEQKLDPLLVEFLDADTTDQRMNILTALHSRITHEMINTIAIVMDLEVSDGELEDRYQQVKFALHTKKKYERTR